MYTIEFYKKLNYPGRELIGVANMVWYLNKLEYDKKRDKIVVNGREGKRKLKREYIEKTFRLNEDKEMRSEIEDVFRRVKNEGDEFIYTLKDTRPNRTNFFLWKSMSNLLELLYDAPIYFDERELKTANRWNNFLREMKKMSRTELVEGVDEITHEVFEYCKIM